MKLNTQKLKEAPQKEFMSGRESALKKRLIDNLRDDGKGHKHAAFADRLADFVVKIVPLTMDPDYTASVNFETGTIKIGEGFLVYADDEDLTFSQLNVLLRHELAHYLMQHYFRMLQKLEKLFGKEKSESLAASYTLHDLNNVLEDFEISNQRYSAEDKKTIRNMRLNGQLVGGLITDRDWKDWASLSLEDMYDALELEIAKIKNQIVQAWTDEAEKQVAVTSDNPVTGRLQRGHYYTNNLPTALLGTLSDFIKDKALYNYWIYGSNDRPCLLKFSSLNDREQKIVKGIFDNIASDPSNTKKDIKEVLDLVTKAGLTETVTLYNPATGKSFIKVYSPEEKLIASDMLKAAILEAEPYQTWYDKVVELLGNGGKIKLTKQQLNELIAELEK